MENTQEILSYCDAFNQKAKQYQESTQQVENAAEEILDELGIVFLSGSN